MNPEHMTLTEIAAPGHTAAAAIEAMMERMGPKYRSVVLAANMAIFAARVFRTNRARTLLQAAVIAECEAAP